MKIETGRQIPSGCFELDCQSGLHLDEAGPLQSCQSLSGMPSHDHRLRTFPGARASPDSRIHGSVHSACGIFSSACHPSFYQFPFEKVFIYNLSEFPFGEMVLKHKQLPSIPGGGTVSIPALFSAYIMGSRGILFFGQDLAFSKGRKYASGSGGLLRHSDSESIQVSGVNGTNVETTKGFHAGIQQMSMMAGLFKEGHTVCYNMNSKGAQIDGLVNEQFETWLGSRRLPLLMISGASSGNPFKPLIPVLFPSGCIA